MPVYQTNVFICEACGHTDSHTEETEQYSGTVVGCEPKFNDWGYLLDPVVKKPDPELFACPKCMRAADKDYSDDLDDFEPPTNRGEEREMESELISFIAEGLRNDDQKPIDYAHNIIRKWYLK